jgi:hypothetical protein
MTVMRPMDDGLRRCSPAPMCSLVDARGIALGMSVGSVSPALALEESWELAHARLCALPEEARCCG